MFFIGLNAYGDENSFFERNNALFNSNRIELRDCIIDEIKMDLSIDISMTPNKKDWSYSTYLLAKFRDNLEAGNISIQELNIEFVKLKRRIKGEDNWQTLMAWNYDPDRRIYEFVDKYVANNETYEYVAIPVSVGGIEGRYSPNEIQVKFENYFLMDKNSTYRLVFNAGIPSFGHNVPSAVFLPVGSRKPIVSYPGELSYDNGTFTGLLFVEDECVDMNDFLSHAHAAKKWQDNLRSFLSNKRPKIIKNESGYMWLISVIDVINIQFRRETFDVVADLSFSWIEIGDKDSLDDLRSAALLEAVLI